jgi:hypothetical protein
MMMPSETWVAPVASSQASNHLDVRVSKVASRLVVVSKVVSKVVRKINETWTMTINSPAAAEARLVDRIVAARIGNSDQRGLVTD